MMLILPQKDTKNTYLVLTNSPSKKTLSCHMEFNAISPIEAIIGYVSPSQLLKGGASLGHTSLEPLPEQ